MKVIILEPVDKFIRSLDIDTQAEIRSAINLLIEYGYDLEMPHVKQINRDIYELRIFGRQSARIFFTFIDPNAYTLSGFVKKQNRTPLRELALAQRRLALLQSYNL